jgi:hypothetical protein
LEVEAWLKVIALMQLGVFGGERKVAMLEKVGSSVGQEKGDSLLDLALPIQLRVSF